MRAESDTTSPVALVVAEDPVLIEKVTRLAAASGVETRLSGDALAALPMWAPSAVVLIEAALVESVQQLQPARRDGVRMVTDAQPTPAQISAALSVGCSAVDELRDDQAPLLTALSHAADAESAQAQVIGVISGHGGAGASTLACGLAQVAGRMHDSVVIDCDRFGPGLDRMLGIEDIPGSRWEDLAEPTGRISGAILRAALPREDGAAVLGWTAGAGVEVPPDVSIEVLGAARRGHRTTVLDLPRSLTEPTRHMVGRCDRLILVMQTGLPQVVSARRLRDALPPDLPVQLAVRGRGTCENDVLRMLDADSSVRVPHVRRIGEHVDLGLGPVPGSRGRLARTCRALLNLGAIGSDAW